jgi:hypothetical protein
MQKRDDESIGGAKSYRPSSNPPMRRAVLDKALPFDPPLPYPRPEVLHPQRLADPSEQGVIRFDEEVRGEDREDRLERGLGGGELVCTFEQ